MRRKSILLLITALLTTIGFMSCSDEPKNVQPLTAEQLYERYKKTVALVYNSYYYEYKINDTLSLYTGSLNSYFVDLYTTREEAIANSSKTFGTAFFIDEHGTMATNLHVAAPDITKEQKEMFYSAFEDYGDRYSEGLSELESEVAELSEYVVANEGMVSTQELSDVKLRLKTTQESYNKLKAFSNVFRSKPDIKKLKVINDFIGVAYEQEQITAPENIEDNPEAIKRFVQQFHPCEVIKKSSNGDIDLAIIRLKDGKTPSNVTHYINFSDNNANTAGTPDSFDIYNAVKINKQVFMIGYNHGLDLAKTAIGIKPQITSGNISQESDGIKVMYTIASLQGSSGSPVIDEWGNLIAVNFAGITNTQSFNYGILSYHLKDLLVGTNSTNKFIKDDQALTKKKEAPAAVEATVIADEGVKEIPAEDDPNYDVQTYQIRSFLEAENGRIVSNIISYYANPVAQYWDAYNLTHEQLKKKYESNWARTKWGKNSVVNIGWYGKNSYIVELNYSFETNDGTTKEVKSKLYIEFNDANKIKVVKSI